MATVITAQGVASPHAPNRALYEAGPIAVAVLIVLLIWGCNWKGGSKQSAERDKPVKPVKPEQETKTDDPNVKNNTNTNETPKDLKQNEQPVDPDAKTNPQRRSEGTGNRQDQSQKGDGRGTIVTETPVGPVHADNVPEGGNVKIIVEQVDGTAGFGKTGQPPPGPGPGRGFGDPPAPGGGSARGNLNGSGGGTLGGGSNASGGGQQAGGASGGAIGSGGTLRGNQLGGDNLYGTPTPLGTRSATEAGTSLADMLGLVARNAQPGPENVNQEVKRVTIDIPADRLGTAIGVPRGYPLSGKEIGGFKLPDLLPDLAKAATREVAVDPPPVDGTPSKPVEVKIDIDLGTRKSEVASEPEPKAITGGEEAYVKVDVEQGEPDVNHETTQTPDGTKLKVKVNIKQDGEPGKMKGKVPVPDYPSLTGDERAKIVRQMALNAAEKGNMAEKEASALYAAWSDESLLKWKAYEEKKALQSNRRAEKRAEGVEKPVEIEASPVKVISTDLSEKTRIPAAAKQGKTRAKKTKVEFEIESTEAQPSDGLPDELEVSPELEALRARLQKVQQKVDTGELEAASTVKMGLKVSDAAKAKHEKRSAKIQRLQDQIKALQEASEKAAVKATDSEKEGLLELDGPVEARTVGSKAKTGTKSPVAPTRGRRRPKDSVISEEELEVNSTDPDDQLTARTTARSRRQIGTQQQARGGTVVDPDNLDSVRNYQQAQYQQQAARSQPPLAPQQALAAPGALTTPGTIAAPGAAPSVITVNGGTAPNGGSQPVAQPGFMQPAQSFAPVQQAYQPRLDRSQYDNDPYQANSKRPVDNSRDRSLADGGGSDNQQAVASNMANRAGWPKDRLSRNSGTKQPTEQTAEELADIARGTEQGVKNGATSHTVDEPAKVATPLRRNKNERRQASGAETRPAAQQEAVIQPIPRQSEMTGQGDEETDGDNASQYDMDGYGDGEDGEVVPSTAPDVTNSMPDIPAPDLVAAVSNPDTSQFANPQLSPEAKRSSPISQRDEVLGEANSPPVEQTIRQASLPASPTATAQRQAIQRDHKMDNYLADSGAMREEQYGVPRVRSIEPDEEMDKALAGTGFLRSEQHDDPQIRIERDDEQDRILAGTGRLREEQHVAPKTQAIEREDELDRILAGTGRLREEQHDSPQSQVIERDETLDRLATGATAADDGFSSPWAVPPVQKSSEHIDPTPVLVEALVPTTPGGAFANTEQVALGMDSEHLAAKPPTQYLQNAEDDHDSAYGSGNEDVGNNHRTSQTFSEADTLHEESSPVEGGTISTDQLSPKTEKYKAIKENIKRQKAKKNGEALLKAEATKEELGLNNKHNNVAEEKAAANEQWAEKQAADSGSLAPPRLEGYHHEDRGGALNASDAVPPRQSKLRKISAKERRKAAKDAKVGVTAELTDASKGGNASSQRTTPPPDYMAAEQLDQPTGNLDDSRGLIRATWFVLTHAKLYSLLTTGIVTIAVEGSRQIIAQMMRAGAAATGALAARVDTTGPDLGPDIELTQPFLTKLLSGSGLTNNQWFMILQLWVALSLFLSLLSLSATIAKAYAPSQNATIRSEITCGWGIIYRAVRNFTVRLFGTVLMSPNWSWRRSSWIYTPIRILLFIALLCTCALVLRQALSLQYLTANNTSTSFSTLPDISRSQETLSKAGINPTTSFIALNAIIAISILVIFSGFYALSHSRAFNPNSTPRIRRAIFALSTLKPLGALLVLITCSLAIWFFDTLTVYTNPAFRGVTAHPEFIFKNVLIATYMMPLFWSVFELWDLAGDLIGQYGFCGWGKREGEDRGRTTERSETRDEVGRGRPSRQARSEQQRNQKRQRGVR